MEKYYLVAKPNIIITLIINIIQISNANLKIKEAMKI